MDLNDYRKEIDSIDDQLIALFAQRMETAEKIAEYKKANGLRVLDARREKKNARDSGQNAGRPARIRLLALLPHFRAEPQPPELSSRHEG